MWFSGIKFFDSHHHCPAFLLKSETLWPLFFCVFAWQSFIKWKRDRETFWHRHQKGDGECPPASLNQSLIYFYQTHSHNIHLKLTRLELTIERYYQTPSHNIHLKITRLSRKFLLRRRNMSLSKIHCCYIIISTELKEKHTLEQDELFCCVIISSGLKEI